MILFVSRVSCVFANTFVSEFASRWSFEFCTCGNMPMIACFPFWQDPFMSLVQGSLFAFPGELLPVSLCVPFADPSSLPFSSLFEFRCGESARESERGRFFPLPFLFGSCSNAHESPNMQSPFGIVFCLPESDLSLIELFLRVTCC